MKRAAALVALAAYAALLVASAPAWPDDWDGVGFVESVTRFDLARFQPHPPGYPVYVALLRVAALVVRAPMAACVAVAALSGVVAAGLAGAAAARVRGARAGWLVGVAVGVAPIAWRACSGPGSEAPALACAAACAWGLAGEREIALGLGVGLGLGVRLSWAPLYLAALAIAPRGIRARAAAVAAAACAAWAAPFAIVVGPAHLASLLAAHFAGHAERWGGTVLTEPGPVRLVWLARDVLVDGLGAGLDPAGVVVAIAIAAAAAQAVIAWREAGWKGWRRVLVVVVPYLVWIGLGQNLREQPRHALPIVALIAGGLALGAGPSRRSLAVGGALVLALAARAGLDARVRRTIAPPGRQLVDLARRQPDAERLAVFGTRSVRFFELSALAGRGFAAGTLGDVEVRLAHMDSLPSRVWLTIEVGGRDASRWPMTPVATLCRPERLERRTPCLGVVEWRAP